MTDDLRELKAGAAAVDPEDYNALIDAVVAGNGGSQPGVSIANPVDLDPCDWALVYDSSENPDITLSESMITANADGALTVDDGSPNVGDRVAVVWFNGYAAGVYVVTDAGDVDAPWVLTRADDVSDAATYCRYWTTNILNGTNYTGGRVYVFEVGPGASTLGDNAVTHAAVTGDGASGRAGSALGPKALTKGGTSVAIGSEAEATGSESTAIGAAAKARGDISLVIGDSASAAGDSATAVGTNATGDGLRSTAVGAEANATATDSTAVGKGAYATASEATAIGKGTINNEAGVTRIDGPNGSKVVLMSPDTTKWYIAVANDGTLSAVAV